MSEHFPPGQRVRVYLRRGNGTRKWLVPDGWYEGVVVPSKHPHPCMVEVRLNTKVTDGDFLDGYGIALGVESNFIRRVL